MNVRSGRWVLSGIAIIDSFMISGRRPDAAADCQPHLDLNLVEGLAVVHTDDAANHLRHDDHVAEVSADRVRLLARGSLLLLHGVERANVSTQTSRCAHMER